MKKILLLILSLFLITGCVKDEIKEQEIKDSKKKTVFEIDKKSEKEFKLTSTNAKKGMEQKASIKLEEGEDILENYSFHGLKALKVYIIPSGKSKDEAILETEVNGEGHSTTSELPGGEYDVLMIVEDEHLTGTYSMKTEIPKDEEEDDE